MGLLDLLGFGTNWNKIEKEYQKQIKWELEDLITDIIFSGEGDVTKAIQKYGEQKVINVLKYFGTNVPTKSNYPDYFLNGTNIPSNREIKKYSRFQKNWDKAQIWLQEKEKNSINFESLEAENLILENIILKKQLQLKELALNKEFKKNEEKIQENYKIDKGYIQKLQHDLDKKIKKDLQLNICMEYEDNV